jgi:deoxyribonuclease-4
MPNNILGGHVSAAGGVDKAIERVAAIGGNALQLFSGSPRVWQRPTLSSIDTKKVFSKREELHVESIFNHSLYLLNLASERPDLVQKSIDVLKFDLQFNALIQGQGVVVHVGSHQGRGWEAVKESVAAAISNILAESPKESYFLIENAASQNGKIGGQLQEIRWLLDAVQSPQLSWCFDTCHGYAGAYYLGEPGKPPTAEAVKGQNVLSALAEIDRLGLAETLRCLHVNDSRDPFGSGRDRHANLGDGEINQTDLAYFLNHELIANKPLILEVPGIEGEGPDAENMKRLKALVHSK